MEGNDERSQEFSVTKEIESPLEVRSFLETAVSLCYDELVRILKILVLIFWVVMVGLLVQKKLLFKSDSASQPFYLKEGDYWIGLHYQGARIGFFHIINSYFSMHLEGELYLNLLGQRKFLRLNGASLFGTDGKIQSFTFELSSNGHSFAASGLSDGEGLNVRLLSGGGAQTKFRLDRNISASALLVPDLTVKPGDKKKLDLLNPITGTVEAAYIEVLGKELFQGRKVNLVKFTHSGYDMKLWVTAEAEIIKAETSQGFTLLREEKEDVLSIRDVPDENLVDIISTVAIDAGREIENPQQLEKLRVRLGGIELHNFDLTSHRQKLLEGGILEVSREHPPKRLSRVPLSGNDLLGYLAPELLIDSNDERILTKANDIVAEALNPWEASLRLNHWVFNKMNKKPVPGIPSSIGVLSSMEGDCNEHSFLFVALARSAGIPSDICTGLTYYKGKFYYHAWPKVYVEEWIEMDPTLGQDLVDATHIKLIDGGIQEQMGLSALIGKIKLKIISVSP